MVNWKSRKLGDVLAFLNVIVLVALINLLVSTNFYRFDLTEEQRYSIKDQTRDILKNLDDDVYVEVYLTGDLNAEFGRFQKAIGETLEEFRIYSSNKVKYKFTDPAAAMSEKARSEFMSELAGKGIQPTNVIDTKDGQRIEKIIFPGVIVSYDGIETGVMLLKGNKAGTPTEEINQSIEGVEYELAHAISKLVNADRKEIGFVSGHGELDSTSIASFKNDLLEEYEVSTVDLSATVNVSRYNALIVAKPTRLFSDLDKFHLDQYIMAGSRTYMPAWKARVDEKEVRVLVANARDLAVAVPAGSHRIEIAWDPSPWYRGLLLQAAALSGLVALALASRRRSAR